MHWRTSKTCLNLKWGSFATPKNWQSTCSPRYVILFNQKKKEGEDTQDMDLASHCIFILSFRLFSYQNKYIWRHFYNPSRLPNINVVYHTPILNICFFLLLHNTCVHSKHIIKGSSTSLTAWTRPSIETTIKNMFRISILLHVLNMLGEQFSVLINISSQAISSLL